MDKISRELYNFENPASWVTVLSEDDIINKTKETEFSRAQIEEERDYCYFLNKIQHTCEQANSEFISMAYTLNDPTNLETASINEVVLEDNEFYKIHRISVIREGKLIDKIPDVQIKILDDEKQSSTGVLNNFKKINITIKDLQLYDIIITENTLTKTFNEDEFLRKDFFKYVWVSPDIYWAYGDFKFTVINDRENQIACKKVYFRDENGNVIAPETSYLQKGEQFLYHQKDYINPVDASREIFPFIDFATVKDWKSLSNYISPIYHVIYSNNKLENFAPFLVEKLDAIVSLDDKLRFAIEYVQNNINYIYNAHEMNGHKPQEPTKTFENKQGDCKAKTVFLKVVLDYIGVDSSVVLVNYNTDVYINDYNPSLLTFNHVIVKISFKNNIYYVDPTIRNEFGLIENRGFLSFKYYLEINPNQELSIRKPFQLAYNAIHEKVDLTVINNVGDFSSTTVYKGNRANNMRKYFKNTNKREIVDSWNNSLYYTMNFVNDRQGTDVRTIFPNASVEIVKDDKNANEITVQYNTSIEKAYFVDTKSKKFLMYYDRNMLKNVRDYMHKDFLFWQNDENEKYEINLQTDQLIDQKEYYTVKEATITNKYFTHTTKKKINKNGASVSIEYKPTTNIEIEKQDFEAYRIAHHEIADSNFGLGLDIVDSSLFNKMKSWF